MAYKHPRLPAPGADADTTRTRKRKPRTRKGTLPAFAPVPRETTRHDGWSPARQQGFIEALADLGSVKAAAAHVGMSAVGAYLLRRHPQADGFRHAWEAALKLGVARLEDVAMDRALNGVEVPIYHFGAVVGTRRVHNDRLLMFILRNRAPKRFAADSANTGDAATRSQLRRLKREWRAEWEAERLAEASRSSEDLCAAIDAKLDRMRQHQLEDHRAPRAAASANGEGDGGDGTDPDAEAFDPEAFAAQTFEDEDDGHHQP